MAEQRKRPFGVIVIIVLQIIGILSLAGDIIGLPLSQLPAIFPIRWYADDSNVALIIGGVILAWQLTLAIGLWFLKRWAWFLIMIQLGVSMAVCLWAYSQGAQLYVYMLINVIMVFYLNQNDVQHAFGHNRRPRQEMI